MIDFERPWPRFTHILAAVGFWIGAISAITVLCVALWFAAAGAARAHTHNGITYPPSCCNSAATSANGDCAPIDGRYVTAKADGYHISLPVGAHPKLKTKGFVGIIPYPQVKPPLDHEYHICLSTDGGRVYCFFAAPTGS